MKPHYIYSISDMTIAFQSAVPYYVFWQLALSPIPVPSLVSAPLGLH